MIPREQLAIVLSQQRRFNAQLMELMDETVFLSDSVDREDERSVRMSIRSRTQPLLALFRLREEMDAYIASLPPVERECLRTLLAQPPETVSPEEEPLVRLYQRNQTLLEQIKQTEKLLGERLSSKRTFG